MARQSGKTKRKIPRYHILATSMEHIPELERGCVLRIHNIKLEN